MSLLALALLVPQGPHKLVTDNFLYVFKPGPTGPGMRAATEGRAGPPSAPASLPLQARPLAWRARANGCRPETTRLVINERHPCSGGGRLPELVTHAVCRLTVDLELRIAPLAIMGSAVRHGTRQGRLRRRKRSSKLAP